MQETSFIAPPPKILLHFMTNGLCHRWSRNPRTHYYPRSWTRYHLRKSPKTHLHLQFDINFLLSCKARSRHTNFHSVLSLPQHYKAHTSDKIQTKKSSYSSFPFTFHHPQQASATLVLLQQRNNFKTKVRRRPLTNNSHSLLFPVPFHSLLPSADLLFSFNINTTRKRTTNRSANQKNTHFDKNLIHTIHDPITIIRTKILPSTISALPHPHCSSSNSLRRHMIFHMHSSHSAIQLTKKFFFSTVPLIPSIPEHAASIFFSPLPL